MSRPREPIEIAYQLLKFIKTNNKTTRWDLIKILGNTRQFHHWVEGFLLKDRFLVEEKEGTTFYYSLTLNGELLLKLLRNGALMRSIVRLSGKRLRRE